MYAFPNFPKGSKFSLILRRFLGSVAAEKETNAFLPP